MIEQQYNPPRTDTAIERLDAALSRIAGAAGKRQDALRAAELDAQSTQYQAADRLDTLNDLATRIDALIALVRAELQELPGEG